MTESFGACFGRLVRRYRGIEGLTQEELAWEAFGSGDKTQVVMRGRKDGRKAREEEPCDRIGYKSRISDLERGKVPNPQESTTVDPLVIRLRIPPEEVENCRKIGAAYDALRMQARQTAAVGSIGSSEGASIASHAERTEPVSTVSPPVGPAVDSGGATLLSSETGRTEAESASDAAQTGPQVAALQLLASASPLVAPAPLEVPTRWRRTDTWRLVLAAIGVILSALALTIGRGDVFSNSVSATGNIEGSTITISGPAGPAER
jgi:hypothetical protein